jgi:tight adherence protein C
MTFLILFSVLIAGAVSLAAYAAWMQTASEKDPMTLRLRQLRALHPSTPRAGYGERPPLILAIIARLGGFLPSSEGRNALRSGLIRAGFRRPEAVPIFLGAKLAFAAGLPLLWVLVATFTGRSVGNILMLALVWAGIGFYLPTLFVGWLQRRRHDEITASLPDSLDLMVVCVEAGLGMTAALQRVSSEMRLASPALSSEVALVHQQMQAGISRTDALRNLAQRTGVEDIYSLVAMLIQTDRLGTSVANALRAHAEAMRVKRRQRAEQLARKAAVKLAFPLVFLILPALLIIILGPAAIQLARALGAE